jgi:hypothetical protein
MGVLKSVHSLIRCGLKPALACPDGGGKSPPLAQSLQSAVLSRLATPASTPTPGLPFFLLEKSGAWSTTRNFTKWYDTHNRIRSDTRQMSADLIQHPHLPTPPTPPPCGGEKNAKYVFYLKFILSSFSQYNTKNKFVKSHYGI